MWWVYDFFKANNNRFGGVLNSDRDNYRPRLYAVSGLNHRNAGCPILRGVGRRSRPADFSVPLSNDGGTSQGSTTLNAYVSHDGIASIVFPNVSLFTQMSLSSSAAGSGTITSAVFYHDFDADGSFDSVASTDTTVTISPGGDGYATVQFVWCSGLIHHFDWSPVASPRGVGELIPVTVTARCSCGDTVTSFADSVDLTGLAATTTTVGSGTGTGISPNTFYHDARRR
jgi:hypothetical protein